MSHKAEQPFSLNLALSDSCFISKLSLFIFKDPNRPPKLFQSEGRGLKLVPRKEEDLLSKI